VRISRPAGLLRAAAARGNVVLIVRCLLALCGLAVTAYGVDGLLTMRGATNPPQAARWLVGGVLVHDLVAFPVAAVIGLLLTRLVKAPYRAVLQGALLVSAAVALSSLPLWRGYGRSAGNPSVDPLPYGRNLAIVLGAVWAGAAGVLVVRAVRARRRRRPTGPAADDTPGSQDA
jgi:hypothetical protein